MDMELQKLGVFLPYLDTLRSGAEVADFARRVEQWGYGTLWLPETFSRDPFVCAAHVLGSTERLTAGTAVAVIWKREPSAMVGAANALGELFPGRFILGLGVSGGPLMRRYGLAYDKPLSAMRQYLDKMHSAPYYGPQRIESPPVMIAALRPKMLALAATRTMGVITTLMPPEAVARVRKRVGPGSWICAQQVMMLETDARRAHTAGRGFMHFYLPSPTYQTHLRAMGFEDTDLAGDGSKRLIDTIIAWGDEARLRGVVAEHFAAGADHVILWALSSAGADRLDERALELLAPRS